MGKLRVAAWVLVCCLGAGADSSVSSDDGQVTARLRGEVLVVSRAGRTLWRRNLPPGELLAVSPRGLAVVGNSPGFVVRGPDLELVDSLPHSLRMAWFDSSEKHLYLMGADGHGYVYSLSGDRRLQVLTPQQMLEQMTNPHCPGEAIALAVGQRLTPSQLAGLRKVKPWTRLALQAFHRQPGAARSFLRARR